MLSIDRKGLVEVLRANLQFGKVEGPNVKHLKSEKLESSTHFLCSWVEENGSQAKGFDQPSDLKFKLKNQRC